MNPFIIAQTVLAVLLIGTILLQNRGAGLGSSFGGGGELYITRRGMERLLFRFTILVAVVFVLVSLTSLIS